MFASRYTDFSVNANLIPHDTSDQDAAKGVLMSRRLLKND